MKRKKLNEDLQTKTPGELEALLTEECKKLAETKLKIRVGQETNRQKAKQQRRTVARIMTVLQNTSEKNTSEVAK
jgi:ribosomal protein L29